MRAAIPLGVPSSSGRAISLLSSSCRLPQWFLYRVHVLRMCSRVCKFSLHSQPTLLSGKNCLRNSPVYACPVRHWTRRPNTSRWFFSSVKCLVGLRDGGILLEIAKRPFFGALCQSRAHAVWVVDLARRRANALDIPIGALQANCVASFASSSALSFPWMLQWLGQWYSIILSTFNSKGLAVLKPPQDPSPRLLYSA